MKEIKANGHWERFAKYVPKKHKKDGVPVKLHRGWLIDMANTFAKESFVSFMEKLELKQEKSK